MIRLALVLPCYNEEEILHLSAKKLDTLFKDLMERKKISTDSFALFVNDGSKDATWDIIAQLHDEYPFVKGLNLAHNVGHQSAIFAGMMKAKDMCDGLITIDADLQDDLMCIEQMVDAYAQGYDVVYGVKSERKADSWMKRMSAQMFYKLQKKMGVDMVYNHADFRFISKRVAEALSRYPERNLYLRGLIPQIGFSSTTVEDKLSEREAGKSKYTLSKMLNLALDGITSFSSKPLYYVVNTGVTFILISIIIAIYVFISLINGNAVHGWASLILSIWFVGGVVLIALGCVGAYVGKIYQEVKRRPLYNEKDFLD
ncbi:MAG: glycosyltransferase family 2 protein [Prevotella sp.]|nr:glycosyltransferase family 2 protein [Candidatus Equicola stercoris]